MTQTVKMKDYWPFFTHGGKIRYDYTGVRPETAPLSAEIFYDSEKQAMCYKEYDVKDGKDVWRDSWFYKYVEGFGVAEFRDDYPSPGRWWGDTKVVVMDPAIGWGDVQQIGSVYENEPAFVFDQCIPPSVAYGDQRVEFERKYDEYQNAHGFWIDVLRFRYYQAWNGGNASGAIYWFAPGRGPVTQQFLARLPNGEVVYSDIYSATVKLVDWPKGQESVA